MTMRYAYLALDRSQQAVVHLLAGSAAAGAATAGQGTPGTRSSVSVVEETVQRRYLIYNQQVPSTRKWRNWQTHQT
jgi:hypothetical protein